MIPSKMKIKSVLGFEQKDRLDICDWFIKHNISGSVISGVEAVKKASIHLQNQMEMEMEGLKKTESITSSKNILEHLKNLFN